MLLTVVSTYILSLPKCKHKLLSAKLSLPTHLPCPFFSKTVKSLAVVLPVEDPFALLFKSPSNGSQLGWLGFSLTVIPSQQGGQVTVVAVLDAFFSTSLQNL